MEQAEKNVEQAGMGKRPRKLSSQAKQQHNVNSAGTSLLMAEKIVRGYVQMNDATRSIEEFPLSCFPSLDKGWRTAKPGSEYVVDPRS